ncbi:TonB-dependent receptor, partial [Porphyromonas levii]
MNIKNVVRFIFVSIAIGYSNIIVAQEAVIHGRVMSADGAPLEFIHVVALSRPDSTYLKSALTNKEGCFELKEESDNYFLRFSFLGYKSVDAIPKDGMVITMVEDVQNLDEVVVTASRLQYKPAGFSYSFKNDHQTSGRKAIDIIGMLPNVSYDPGNISILGRAVSAIYIGNMRSDIKEVEALRADQIEKVEIDYSSVGSEDVTSLGGVLRITLKSIEKNGLRGVLTGEGNYYPYYGIIDGNIYN